MQIKHCDINSIYIMQEIRNNRQRERETEREKGRRVKKRDKKEKVRGRENLIFCGGDEKSTSEVFSMCFATCSASYGQTSRVQ